MLHIEAVTVCVGYGDILAEVARHNAGQLDRWIIVTTEDDEETREICRVHDLETVLSNEHKRSLTGDGADFNKGCMINRGLQLVSADAWRLHLDADIVLPHTFKRVLEGAHIDPRKVYGADRLMVDSEEQWHALVDSGWLNHTNCSVNLPAGIEVGTRWALGSTGYVPIGFFQLWHAAADEWRGRRHRGYPVHHADACRTDVQHALQWDRRDRELLPEVVVVHLQPGPAAVGANWSGRTTRKWQGRHHHHHHHHHRPPYGGG